MPHAYITSADVLSWSLEVPDGKDIVSTVLNDAPMLRRLAADARPGTQFKLPRMITSPVVGFRAANTGRLNTKPSYDTITVESGILDGSNAIDKAVADGDLRGSNHAISENIIRHVQAALAAAESQSIYGYDSSQGFNLSFHEAVPNTSNEMCVDGGGSTSGTDGSISSVWVIRTSPDNVQMVWGNDGEIKADETREQAWYDPETQGTFTVYYTPVLARASLQIVSKYDIVRIANLSVAKPLDDDLIADALSRFPASRGANLIVMNRRSLKQLQQSRTATNALGSPAPFPTEAFGVEICTTDQILSTELTLGATS